VKKFKAIFHILKSRNFILIHHIKEKEIGNKYFIEIELMRHTKFTSKGDLDAIIKAMYKVNKIV
jgi:hypothetical protein